MPPSWEVLAGLARRRRTRFILRVLGVSQHILHCVHALLGRFSESGDNEEEEQE